MSDRRFSDERNKAHPASMTAADKQKSELKRKILGFAHLSNGWDGYDGEAPNLSDIGNAVDFLEKIPAHRVLAARPVVVGDGEVGFAWDMGNCYMGIIFVHEDVFFYSKTPAGKQHANEKQYSKHSDHVLMKFQTLMNQFFDNVN